MDLIFTKLFWDMGTGSFEVLFKDLVQMEPRSLTLTREVLKEREHLEATVKGLQPQIKNKLAQIDTLKQERRELKKHEGDINSNKEFTYTVTEQRQILVPLKPGEIITTCMSCHATCHYPCKIPNKDDKKECAVMDANGKCTVCPGQCSWNVHDNTAYYYDIEEVKVEKTHDAQKATYEAAIEGKSVMQSIIDKREKELNALNIIVNGMINEVRLTLRRLNEIALKPNPLTQVEYVDILIQTERQDAKTGFQERIAALYEIREKAKLISEEALEEHSRGGGTLKSTAGGLGGLFGVYDWRSIWKNLFT